MQRVPLAESHVAALRATETKALYPAGILARFRQHQVGPLGGPDGTAGWTPELRAPCLAAMRHACATCPQQPDGLRILDFVARADGHGVGSIHRLMASALVIAVGNGGLRG